MTKVKYFITILFTILLLMIIPNFAQATVEYTRTITGNDGSITINLTGIELDETKAYSFALTTKGGTPETWHTLTEYTTNTAKVPLSSATSDIVDVLKVTDTGVLYLKDNSDDSYVVNALQVDLKLPYLQAIPHEHISHSPYGFFYIIPGLYGSIGDQHSYDRGNTYCKIEKVKSKELVQAYLDNNKDSAGLEYLLPTLPKTGYTIENVVHCNDVSDGLYIIWVKLTGKDCKDVYGAILYDGKPDATTVAEYLEGVDLEGPTVSSIAVTSPASGTYTTGQTVKITVTFSEDITGSTVPTLKIKFGTSEERAISNGTISGKTIVYSYNIVASDVGQLAVTGYSGGTIKDASGNDAVISSKTISGNTIKANVAGENTNNTGNQDKTNNGTPSTTDPTQNLSSGNNNPGTDEDKTIAPTVIPKAGVGIAIMFAIIAVLGVAMIARSKYNKLRDI